MINQFTVKLTKEEQKLAALENHKAHELIYNLVVKIIVWKSGKFDGSSIKPTNKVSPNEWSNYKKHMLNISKVESVEKVRERLEDTKQAIKLHGGFK